MEFQNGQFLSAYTKNDTIFEGNVYTRLDGTKVVLNEKKRWLPISELKNIKIIQEADEKEQDIQKLVDVDIGKCDIDKLGALDDLTLNKVGDKREGELIKSGIKINKGDYSTRFANSVKANSLAKDANAGNISVSTALEKYKQSKDADIEMRINKTLKESFEDDDLLDSDFDNESYNTTTEEEIDDSFDDFDFDDFEASYDEDVDDIIVDKQEDESFEDDDSFDVFTETTLKERKTPYDKQKDKDYDDALSKLEKNGEELPDSEKAKEIEESVEKEFESAFDKFEESVVRYDESKLYEFICNEFGYDIEKGITDFQEAILNLEENEVKRRLSELTADGRYTGDERDLSKLFDIRINGRTFPANPQLVGLQKNIAQQTAATLQKKHPDYTIEIIQHIN